VGGGRVAPLYRWKVACFGIDAPTLLHLVAEDIKVAPAHQLVAPTPIRSQALALLLAGVQRGSWLERTDGSRTSMPSTSPCASCRPMLVTIDRAIAEKAADIVPTAPLDVLSSG